MSGGHFDYRQHSLNDIADEIEQLIRDNDSNETNEYGDVIGRHYPPQVIKRFKQAAHNLYRSAEMVQRVDWLVSDDDGIDSFMDRWDDEVRGSWDKHEEDE